MSQEQLNKDFYFVISEWKYPSETGMEVYPEAFTSPDDAMHRCKELARVESIFGQKYKFNNNSNLKITWGPYIEDITQREWAFTTEESHTKKGYIVKYSKEYYFRTRVVGFKLSDDKIPLGQGIYEVGKESLKWATGQTLQVHSN